MIIVDESLSPDIREYIELNCGNVKKLNEFDELIPSNVFNVILVDESNLATVQSKIHQSKNTFLFIFWEGEKSLENNLRDIDFYFFIHKALSTDAIKKQLEIFVKESSILEKVKFNLNRGFKAELEERALFLRSIESKLSEVHKNLVPLRKAIAPNMKLFSKYALGSDVGGEFIDFEKTDGNLFLIMFSTNSYLLSSDLVEIVLQLRKNKMFNFNSFKEKIIEFTANRKEKFSFLTAEINFKTLDLEIFSDGYKVVLNSVTQELITGETSSIEIKAGDKALFFSPGIMTYLKNAGLGLNKIYKNNVEESFNEVFSEVRSAMTSGLGGPDATLALLEVQNNAFKTV